MILKGLLKRHGQAKLQLILLVKGGNGEQANKVELNLLH
jgi:hypothetical protein